MPRRVNYRTDTVSRISITIHGVSGYQFSVTVNFFDTFARRHKPFTTNLCPDMWLMILRKMLSKNKIDIFEITDIFINQ